MRRATRKLKKEDPLWPPKYYKGLSRKVQTERRKEILKYGRLHWKNPSAYVGFKTDVGASLPRGEQLPTRGKTSQYTRKFRTKYPKARSLRQKSDATGVPLWALRESYNRGMAAWRTGHRPGMTQQEWGYARVHSLLTCGKTFRTTDADIVRRASATSRRARAYFDATCK